MDVLRYGIRRRNHEAHVWVFGFSQRRRHAYIDCVQCPDDREIGGRAQFPALDEGCKRAVGNVFDIGLTGVELVYFGSLNINANNVKPGFCELDCERQANVTETKNPTRAFLLVILDCSSAATDEAEGTTSWIKSVVYRWKRLDYIRAPRLQRVERKTRTTDMSRGSLLRVG